MEPDHHHPAKQLELKAKRIEEKFHKVKWAGLSYEEKVCITKHFHKRHKNITGLQEELDKLKKYPDTYLPLVVLAETNRLALQKQDPAVMNAIHLAFHGYGKTIIPLGISEEEAIQALNKYQADMS